MAAKRAQFLSPFFNCHLQRSFIPAAEILFEFRATKPRRGTYLGPKLRNDLNFCSLPSPLHRGRSGEFPLSGAKLHHTQTFVMEDEPSLKKIGDAKIQCVVCMMVHCVDSHPCCSSPYTARLLARSDETIASMDFLRLADAIRWIAGTEADGALVYRAQIYSAEGAVVWTRLLQPRLDPRLRSIKENAARILFRALNDVEVN